MIKAYKIKFRPAVIPASVGSCCNLAYPLYAELMSRCSDDFADELHRQGITPISQYISFEEGACVWYISLFGEAVIEEMSPIIASADTFTLHDGGITLSVGEIESEMLGFDELIKRSAELPDDKRFKLTFVTPTAFKSAGRYIILPDTTLIFKNLIQSWNAVCPRFILDDADMLNILLDGINITAYRLSSGSYRMKGVRIPSFIGSLTLGSRLPPPVTAIYKVLILYSKYAGVGIKTALGMGGLQIN